MAIENLEKEIIISEDESTSPQAEESILNTQEKLEEKEIPQTGDFLQEWFSTPDNTQESNKTPEEDDEEEEEDDLQEKEIFDSEIIYEVLGFAEDMNINLCMSISGETEPKKFKQSDDKLQNLSKKLERYLITKGFTVSPLTGLLMSISLFFGVPLYTSYNISKKKKKERQLREQREQQAEEQRLLEQKRALEREQILKTSSKKDEQLDKFANLKERVQKRISFKLHSSGAYKYAPNSTKEYIAVDQATEFPSKEVQELINQEKSCQEIRKILGYDIK